MNLQNLFRPSRALNPSTFNVRDEETGADARRRLEGVDNVHFHRIPLNDVWFRDNGAALHPQQRRQSGAHRLGFQRLGREVRAVG